MRFREKIAEFFGLRKSMVALLAMVILVGLGEKMAERFLPIYLMALGGGAFTIGLLSGMTNLLSALYSFPGGYLSDHLGYKKALLVFNLIALFGYAIVIIFPYWQAVLIGAIFFLSWSAISLPATMSLVSRVLPPDKRTMGVSLHSLVRRLPMALGPIIGGVLIGIYGEKTGVRLAFVGAFILGIVSLLLQQVMIEDDKGERGKAEKRPSRLWRFMNPSLRNLLVSDILIRFAEQIPYAFVVVWCIKYNGITATEFGILTAIEMTTALLIYLPVAYLADRSTKKPFVVITFFNFTHFPAGHLFCALFLDDGCGFCNPRDQGIWRADAQSVDYGSGAGRQKGRNVWSILFDSGYHCLHRRFWRSIPLANIATGKLLYCLRLRTYRDYIFLDIRERFDFSGIGRSDEFPAQIEFIMTSPNHNLVFNCRSCL